MKTHKDKLAAMVAAEEAQCLVRYHAAIKRGLHDAEASELGWPGGNQTLALAQRVIEAAGELCSPNEGCDADMYARIANHNARVAKVRALLAQWNKETRDGS
jgi:hypothetical protein